MSKVFKAVGNAITSVAKAVVNVVSSVVKAVVNVVSDVINFVASPFMGLLGAPNVPDAAAEAQRQDGVLLTKQGGGAVPIPVIYGYRRTGGIITFCETGNTNNKYLWVAYVFSEGCVEGLNELFIDDTQLSADVVRGLNSGQIVDVPDAKYKGRVKLQWFPGVYFSDPASSPIGTTSILKEAPSWKSSMVYNGLAVLFARYEWLAVTTQEQADANPFTGGIPQIQASILGKKIASLRTSAGTENYTYGGAGYTERYSTNPAEVLLDYLRNPRYGKGLVNADIDWSSFYVAAQKCNQEIKYTSAVSGPILTMNLVLDTNQTLFSNIKTILLNFRAYLPYVQGKYKLKIEDAGNPTDILSGAATIAGIFNRDSILGEITYTGIERSAKYNQVVVTYVDPDQKFSTQQVVYPENEAERQIYINFDGGRENKSEVTMAGITNQQIARDMARLIFNKSRYQETCSLTVSAEGFNLEVGDNIYIQSNILNFGTTPWRIVSIKLTNEYTFDLGCVRNPDFIYPYVIPNTPDQVIAPYIPKGASILPPLSGGQSLVGLVPPVTAPILSTGVTTSTTTPPTTITTGTNGGGVGGSTGTVNTGGGTPPVTPPVTNILKDVITVDNISFTYPQTGIAYADLTFNQPSNAMYEGVTLYFKSTSAIETVWTPVSNTDKPGAGKPIKQRIGPLILNNIAYEVKSRIKYSTGEYSTVIGKINFLPSTTGQSLNPEDWTEVAQEGWNLITSGTSARNDVVGFIEGATVLTSGSPSTPRTLDITLQQNYTNYAVNSDIVGVKIFYKASVNTYWKETSINFINYVPGTKTTVRLSDLGTPGSSQNYDMVFRFIYRDGTQSTNQTRFMSMPVETSLGLNQFNPFYVVLPKTEVASTYSLITEEQAITSGLLTDVRDTRIGVVGCFWRTINGQPMIEIHVTPPDNSVEQSWIGAKIYYRPVVSSGNPEYTTLTFSKIGVVGSVGSLVTRYFRIPVTLEQVYQIVVVPTVFYGGSTIEGRYGWFGQGYVSDQQRRADYPSDSNWAPSFKWRSGDTSLLLGELKVGFVQANPTAIVKEFKAINGNTASYDSYTTTPSVKYLFHNYYKLVLDVGHIGSDLKKVHIYRRYSRRSTSTGVAKYYGIGRWERLSFTTAYSGYNSTDKTFTLLLRPPQSGSNFATYATTIATMWTTYIKNGAGVGPPTVVEVQPNTNIYQEYAVVIETNSTGMSPKALKMSGTGGLNTLTPSIDILKSTGPFLPIDWPMSDDATYDIGWFRRISEAQTGADNQQPVAAGNLWYGYSTSTAYISGVL